MSERKIGKEIVNHFQSGVSYIIPLVTAAGLLTSIAVIFGGTGVWDQTDNLWGVIRMIGQTGLGFITPMIAAYISYSIADRPGLAPAFIVGLVAKEMGTGFLGGMIVGLAVGYLVEALKKIPVPQSIISVKSILLIPFLATLIVGLLLYYVIGTPITTATEALTNWLNSMTGANAVVLGAILGAMMAIDMGGPINKIAYAFGTASFSAGAFLPSTAMLAAIAIPNLGLFLATLIGKKYFSEAERENGKTAIVMGAVGITEGSIPFAVADPLRVIPSIVVGTSLATAIIAGAGITHKTMLSTFMAIPFTNKPILYTVALFIGGAVTAGLVVFLKSIKFKKDQKGSAE